MSIFKRLKDVTFSHIHAMIDKAEDPIQMTDQYLRNMQEDVKDAENAVAAQIALEKKTKALLEEQETLMEKREEQANEAAKAKNLDLARRALEDKRIARLKMEEYQTQYDSIKQTADKFRNDLNEMYNQISELRNKREALVARAKTAKAKNTVNQSKRKLDLHSYNNDFTRMEDKVRELEAQAEISEEFVANKKDIDKEIDEINAKNEIDAELEELMKKYE